MGEVWRGHDEAGNVLAFKLLLPHFTADPGVVSRFMRERAILIRVQSPFVVAIHDLVAERGDLAIVMEYVEGSDLRQELYRRRTLPPAEAVSLIVDILTGLATAHRLGIVHRDLKPENVLLDRRDGMSRPKVSDFGIAGLCASATRLTVPGGMLGTPLYMAPESVDGGVVGPAADVYAAGTMLYEMLCGVAPFAGREMLSILRAHADLAPGRPPGIPDELWTVLAAMLAKDPRERPDIDRLQALLPGLTGMAAGLSLDTPPASSRIHSIPVPGQTRFRPGIAIRVPARPGASGEAAAALLTPLPAPITGAEAVGVAGPVASAGAGPDEPVTTPVRISALARSPAGTAATGGGEDLAGSEEPITTPTSLPPSASLPSSASLPPSGSLPPSTVQPPSTSTPPSAPPIAPAPSVPLSVPLSVPIPGVDTAPTEHTELVPPPAGRTSEPRARSSDASSRRGSVNTAAAAAGSSAGARPDSEQTVIASSLPAAARGPAVAAAAADPTVRAGSGRGTAGPRGMSGPGRMSGPADRRSSATGGGGHRAPAGRSRLGSGGRWVVIAAVAAALVILAAIVAVGGGGGGGGGGGSPRSPEPTSQPSGTSSGATPMAPGTGPGGLPAVPGSAGGQGGTDVPGADPQGGGRPASRGSSTVPGGTGGRPGPAAPPPAPGAASTPAAPEPTTPAAPTHAPSSPTRSPDPDPPSPTTEPSPEPTTARPTVRATGRVTASPTIRSTISATSETSATSSIAPGATSTCDAAASDTSCPTRPGWLGLLPADRDHNMIFMA